MTMSTFLKNRLSEPSTWAGIALLAAQAAQAWATKDPQAIGAVVAGAAAVLLPEKKVQ